MQAHPSSQNIPWVFLLLFSLAMTLIAQSFNGQLVIIAKNFMYFGDTDNAMRAVQAEDLLNGQSWFDTTQHRINPPFGGEMHWSRLVDAPIATLQAVSSTLIQDQHMAKIVAYTIWPALVLWGYYFASLMVLFYVLRAKRSLILGAAVILFAPWLTAKFRPFSLDHHNIQMTLMVTTLSALAFQTNRAMVCAGVFLGLSLAIGFETLPYVAVILMFVMGGWVAKGEEYKSKTARIIWAITLTISFLYAATTPIAHFGANTFCDALSLNTLTTAFVGACVWQVMQILNINKTMLHRAMTLGLMACVIVITHHDYALSCLSGPYAMLSPHVISEYISKINEVKGLWHHIQDPESIRAEAVYIGGYAIFAGLFLVFFASKKKEHRLTLSCLIALLSVSFALSFDQVRSLMYVEIFSILAGAMFLMYTDVNTEKWTNATKRILTRLGATAIAIPIFGLASVIMLQGNNEQSNTMMPSETITEQENNKITPSVCGEEELPFLNTLPKEVIFASIDYGPFILAHTHHSVVVAPYHRNAKTIEITLQIFGATDSKTAQRLLSQTQATMLLTCAKSKEADKNAGLLKAGTTLYDIYEGKVPDWLEPVELKGLKKLRLYRINHPS